MKRTAEERHQLTLEKHVRRLTALSPQNRLKNVCKVWQKLVRLQAVDSLGCITCYTCDAVYPHKPLAGKNIIHAGHFVARKANTTSTDLHPDNCRPQCANCNKHLSGNLGVYQERLTREIGPERVARLLAAKNEPKRWLIEELAALKIRLLAQCRAEQKRIDG